MEAEDVKRYLLLDRVLRLTETSDVSSAVLSTFISADGTLLTISREDLPSGQVHVPSNHETLSQCWLNVGPTSQTVGQHRANIGVMSLVFSVKTL